MRKDRQITMNRKNENMYRHRKHPESSKGLTLLEMVISLAMMSIIFTSIVPQFTAIRNGWDSRRGAAESLQNGRILIDHLNRNLAKAVKITAVSDSSETDGYIQFEANDGNDLRYEVAASYVQFGEVDDLSDLAGPTSKLQFTCYDACDLDTPLDISTADINDIRFVKAEITLTNSAALGRNKTLFASAYLRTNENSDSLIGWWKLDETSGLAAADSSGNGNDGTLNNMAGNEWTTGQIDGALEFDGDNDHIAGIGNCPTGDYTVAGWAKDTGGSGWKALYSADQEIWLGVNSGASAAVWLDCGGNNKGANTAAGTWTQNAWRHIAATWDGTDLHLYLDGIDMTITTHGTPENAMAKAAVIGAWSKFTTDENWFGTLDDVRVYDRALTADEIVEIMAGVGGTLLP